MIPTKVLDRWEKDTAYCEDKQIRNLCELRGYLVDAKAEGDRVIMEMYAESAPRFRMTRGALQNKISVLREYPAEKLIAWIEAGYSFSTISRVNELSSMGMITEAPGDLLDELATMGNGDGKTPTADEVEKIVNERHGIKSDDYIFNRIVYRLAKFAKLINYDGFVIELRALIERYK